MPFVPPSSAPPSSAPRAAAPTLILDSHADTAQRFLDEGWEFTSPAGSGQLSFEAARTGGLGGEIFAAWVDPGQYTPDQYVPRTLELIDSVREQVRRHPGELALCLSAEDVLRAHRSGRFAALLGIEGGHSIANSLGVLRCFYTLGVRCLTLTWANSNDWAESCTDLREPGSPTPVGLTAFGREVVAEMNRLGMLIDVSHSSDRTLGDVLAVSRSPILASHSSARALCDSPRNLTDDQLRAIAANGGAVMVNFYSAFIDESYREALNASKPEREAAHRRQGDQWGSENAIPFHVANGIDREFADRIPRPGFEKLMTHFEHMIAVAGIDHVGIGTDFDGISALPEGIDSAADLGKIGRWLSAKGYTQEEVAKVLHGNFLRVLGAVEAAAKG